MLTLCAMQVGEIDGVTWLLSLETICKAYAALG